MEEVSKKGGQMNFKEKLDHWECLQEYRRSLRQEEEDREEEEDE